MIIRDVSVKEWSLELVAPFSVATRTAHVATNVLVEITSNTGITGYGAAAPVEYITGETQRGAVTAISDVVSDLLGLTVDHLNPLLLRAGAILSDKPAARAAVEMALYDLWAKKWQIPLWEYFGGAASSLTTDLTVPIVTADEARSIVKRSITAGFDRFKIKVGDVGGVRVDLARIEAVADEAPLASLMIDANQAFTADQAIAFVKNAQSITDRIQMIEQPVPREDYEGLRHVRQHIDLPLFADESARTYLEAKTLIRVAAVDGINIKLMKSGICDAVDIAALCRRNGLRLMVGCMLESPLGIAAAAALAAGFGGFEFIDLDSHVLLKPVVSIKGPFQADGPYIHLDATQPGWGVDVIGEDVGTLDQTKQSANLSAN